MSDLPPFNLRVEWGGGGRRTLASALRTRWPTWNDPTIAVDVPFAGDRLARFWTSPDYAGIPDASGLEFLRLPADPRIYQEVADQRGWSFPVPPLVDAIVAMTPLDRRIRPPTLHAARTAFESVLHHAWVVEERRKEADIPLGTLWTGAKKDIVTGCRCASGMVVLYGWHRPNGAPIQPVSAGHSASYVDYSHGWRPVLGEVELDGHVVPYADVIRDRALMELIFPAWFEGRAGSTYAPVVRYE